MFSSVRMALSEYQSSRLRLNTRLICILSQELRYASRIHKFIKIISSNDQLNQCILYHNLQYNINFNKFYKIINMLIIISPEVNLRA